MVEVHSLRDLRQMLDEDVQMFIAIGKTSKQLTRLEIREMQVALHHNEAALDSVSNVSVSKLSPLHTSAALLIVAQIGAARLVDLLKEYDIDPRMDGIYFAKKHEAVVSL